MPVKQGWNKKGKFFCGVRGSRCEEHVQDFHKGDIKNSNQRRQIGQLLVQHTTVLASACVMSIHCLRMVVAFDLPQDTIRSACTGC